MHAEISFHGNRHYLRDLGSRNGTFVNENLVVTPCVLKNDDTIRVGGIRLKFNTSASAPSAAPETPKQAKTEFIKKQSESEHLGQLIIYSGATIGLSFALKPPSVSVGRESEGNDIALQNQTVSRKHARLDWRDGKWYVTDLGSGNGTHINGRLLSSDVEVALAAKDEAQFGDVKLMYIPPSASPQPKPVLPMTFIIEPEVEPEPSDTPQKIVSNQLPEIDATPPIKKADVVKKIAELPEEKPVDIPPVVPVEVKPQIEAQPQAPAEVKPPVIESTSGGGGSEPTQFMQSAFPTRLTVLAGPAIGRTILLVNLPTTLGRATTPEVQGLDDPLVSRQHLRIILNADGNIGVSDLGSVNGTILNGILLTPNQVVFLKKGDELRMGSTVLKAG
jgi:pSer/pThr/pTyr-binding forkhead associated (FHA) protein